MEDEQPKSLRDVVEKIAVGLVAVLVVYVLSIGPAARFMYFHDDQKTHEFIGLVYSPAIWVGVNAKPIGVVGLAYIKLWIPN